MGGISIFLSVNHYSFLPFVLRPVLFILTDSCKYLKWNYFPEENFIYYRGEIFLYAELQMRFF